MNSYNPKLKQKFPPLHEKWSGPRVVRAETTPYHDPGIDFTGDPGVTDKSHAAEADVNFIMKRYTQTGILPSANREGIYDDFTTRNDFLHAQNVILHAQSQFDGLDAHVRAFFENDPAKFLDFMADDKNRAKAVELGLASIVPQTDGERIVEELRKSRKDSKPNPSPADSDSE